MLKSKLPYIKPQLSISPGHWQSQQIERGVSALERIASAPGGKFT